MTYTDDSSGWGVAKPPPIIKAAAHFPFTPSFPKGQSWCASTARAGAGRQTRKGGDVTTQQTLIGEADLPKFNKPICPRGHVKAEVGVYSRYRCKACLKEDQVQRNARNRRYSTGRFGHESVDWERHLGHEPERWLVGWCTSCKTYRQKPAGAKQCGYCAFPTEGSLEAS